MTIAALRYNNPGNVSLPIQGWNGGGTIVGISGQPGYASFPDMATGLAAMNQRVTNYIDVKGLNTIGALNSVYAQDSNWKNSVSAISGIGVNTPLDTSNSSQMASLQGAIIQHETGLSPSTFGFSGNGSTDLGVNATQADYSSTGLGTIGQSASGPYGTLNSDAFSGSGLSESGAFNTSGPNVSYAGAGQPIDANNPGSISGIVGSDFSAGNSSAGGPGTGLAAALGNNVSPGAVTSGALNSGPGAPIVITDITGAGNTAAQTLSKTLNQDTQSGIKAGTTWLQSLELSITDWTVRGGLILLALVLLMGAWVFYSTDGRKAIV